MSFSSSIHLATNEIIAKKTELLDLVSQDNIASLLAELDYDWEKNAFNPEASLVSVLKDHDFVEVSDSGLRLNRMGLLFLSRLLLHFNTLSDGDTVFGSLTEKYKDFEVRSSGRNSVVVRARHKLLGTTVLLKLVRPGASANIATSIGRLSGIKLETALVLPIDFVEVQVRDVLGKPLLIGCLIFPFVEGITFREFLTQRNHHLNSQVVISFARQIGAALHELERIEAYHGDLHEENILVDQYSKGGIRFKIVDISFDAMGSLPLEDCRNNDLSNFKQHIWRILSIQKSFMPRVSLRKYIGTRSYIRITEMLSEKTTSFADVCHLLENDAPFNYYLLERTKFISERFPSPPSFRLQRYEEITDQTVAVRLFVPFEQLMQKVVGFGNVFVSGNRGSGKSTYLAALAFFPQADAWLVDFRETFGIYFPCRQGEFRPLMAREGWDRETERKLITNLMVIKIIRRTLETLSTGIGAAKLGNPLSLDRLREMLTEFVPPPGFVSVDHDIQTEIENFVSTMVRVEMEQIDQLPNVKKASGTEKDVRCLIEFFTIIRETFTDLSVSRFHLLFDDAGIPYVPYQVQRVINDLILTSNSIFCVKLSAEKLTFAFESSDGKVLENGQDYFEHDISQILFIGSRSSGLERRVLEQYFRHIVEQRLVHFSYKSKDIRDYLGDEKLPYDELLDLLANGRKDAYYCGWTTVWNIADRTPRNLLEIVSEIFVVGKIDHNSEPGVIAMRDQDRAIRTISEKRLESLSQISGAIAIGGKQVSLGQHLFQAATAIGSTFRKYLRAMKARKQIRQHLAIERNDLAPLTTEADNVLRRLITFGVLDSVRAAYARDDEIKKPFYVLNRIYCPAFGIAYRRDEHLRLSKGKLEMLLVDPQRFIREGTRRLRNEPEHGRYDLFGPGE